jgi:hypothetical protein
MTPSPSELKKAEEIAKNIVNKYADLCMPKQEAWNELEFMIREALRRQTRDVLNSPEVLGLVAALKRYEEDTCTRNSVPYDIPKKETVDYGIQSIANFQRFREENSK